MQPQKNANTHVTSKQGAILARIVRANGIPRKDFDNFLSDEERLTSFLKGFNAPLIWSEKIKTSVKVKYANVFFIPNLIVDYSLSLEQAVRNLGVILEPSELENLLKTETEYKLTEKGEVKEDIVLVNFIYNAYAHDTPLPSPKKWPEENGLRNTSAHVPLAIAKSYPNLNKTLKSTFLKVRESTERVGWDHRMKSWRVQWNNEPQQNPKKFFSVYLADSTWLSMGSDWITFRK